ncbi:MAG: hypothetical protein ACLTWK_00290 [Eisenbergiella sp.]
MGNKLEELKDKINTVINGFAWINNDGGIQIYKDYNDGLSKQIIKDILRSENPRDMFYEFLTEWASDYEIQCGSDDLEKEIKNSLTEEEVRLFDENFDEIWDFIRDMTYFYYDEDDFNEEVKLNLMVDCGNFNTDCTEDNVLNYYGNGSISPLSSMLWLAKTQKKAIKLRKACASIYKKDGNYVTREVYEDRFIESCIQEFENLPSHMGTLTFLLKIKLLDLFDLIELQKREFDDSGKYDPRLNTKSKSYIVIDKNTECGLFDPWSGGGSVLEVRLDNDVKLPIKYALFTVDGVKTYGYDVDEVYGLIDSCWSYGIKEIKEIPMTAA